MDKSGHAPRAALRCPACAFMAPLPATHCPRCGANLSTGFIPVNEELENAARRKRRLVAGLALLLIIGLSGLLFALFKPPAPAALPSGPAHSAGAAAETLQSLSEQSGAAVGVRPDIIINRTKAVAGQVEEKQRENLD